MQADMCDNVNNGSRLLGFPTWYSRSVHCIHWTGSTLRLENISKKPSLGIHLQSAMPIV